jgi:hypothetical protein
LINTYSSEAKFKEVSNRLAELVKKRVFFHKYVETGADEMEIIERESNLNDLLSEY